MLQPSQEDQAHGTVQRSQDIPEKIRQILFATDAIKETHQFFKW